MSLVSKRQRRSYSCGPCKMLKIKCDLQLPCSSCQRFKREDRCVASPPHPPSDTELKVIQERRERMNKRKQVSHDHYPRHFVNNSGDPANNIGTSVPIAVSNPGPPNPPAPPGLSGPRRFRNEPYSMPLLHTFSHSSTFPSPEDLLNYSKISDYFTQKKVSLSSLHTGVPHVSCYATSQGVLIFEMDMKENGAINMYLDSSDVNTLKHIYPNHSTICKLFLAHFRSFKDDLLEMADYPFTLVFALRFCSVISETAFNTPMYISKQDNRLLSLVLVIFASGLVLHPEVRINPEHLNSQVKADWISFSKLIRDKHKGVEKLPDILYLMSWYCEIHNYCYLHNMLTEDHFEYNNLLSIIIFDQSYVDLIMDKNIKAYMADEEKVQEFKALWRAWIRYRILEIETLYFQHKSVILRSSSALKGAMVATSDFVKLAFGESPPIQSYATKILIQNCACYFDEFSGDVTHQPTEALIAKYLRVYRNAFRLHQPNIESLESAAQRNAVKIDMTTLRSYYKCQNHVLYLIQYLGFISNERQYFPSLRYITYMTAMITCCNAFNYLDDLISAQSNGHDNLINNICLNMTYSYLGELLRLFSLNHFYLIVLKNHVDGGKHVIDLGELYEVMGEKFAKFYQKFMSAIEHTELLLLPLFRMYHNIFIEMNTFLHEKISLEHTLTFEHFRELLSKQIPNSKSFIEMIFGSRESFTLYLERLWSLFEFIKTTNKDLVIKLTSTINFSHKLLMSYKDNFMGFSLTDEIIDDYIENVIPKQKLIDNELEPCKGVDLFTLSYR